ncbi:hypothetical protein D3C87_1668890 [compost metagenome]
MTVVESAAGNGDCFPAGNQATLVLEIRRIKREVIVADQFAAPVIEGVAFQAEAVEAGNFTFLIIEVAQVCDAQHAFGIDLASLVIKSSSVEFEA